MRCFFGGIIMDNKTKNIIIIDQIISKTLLILLLLSTFDERWILHNIMSKLFHGYNISFLGIVCGNILYHIIEKGIHKQKLKRDKWKMPD